jgi:hypothetical protein
MNLNETLCFVETDDCFQGGKILVNIAYIEHLNCLSVAMDVIVNDDRHTIYIPYASIPLVVQSLSSSYFGITENQRQMEAETDGE